MPATPGMAQVPTWSQDDLDFFLHGSMSTEVSGNANSGHDYGTKLSAAEKRDLMEYLKTL